MKLLINILLIFGLLCGNVWGGVDLSGDNDKIVISDSADFDIATAVTISMWFKSDAAPGDADRVFYTLEAAVENKSAYIVTNGAGFNVVAYFHDGIGPITSSTVLDIGTWYNLIVWYDGTDFKIYIDGVQDATQAETANVADGSSDIYVAGSLADGYPFNGKVTDFAWWDVALTASERALLASSRVKRMPLQIQPSNLVVYLPLDDYSDTSNLNTDADGYKDLSGNANHGQGVDANSNSYNISETLLSYP